jgi:ribonuclease P protein component
MSLYSGRLPDETDVSTQSNSSKAFPRLSRPDEQPRGSCGSEASAGKGAKTPRCRDSLEVTMSPGTGRFRRADRLLKSLDFGRVGREGCRRGGSSFVVMMASAREEGCQGSRLGVTVSRRVGNAVVRNRVKRRVREWFRCERGRFGRPLDVVVIARPSAARLEMVEVSERLSVLAFGTQAGRKQ